MHIESVHGPAVLGQEEFDRQQKIRIEHSDVFGPAVLDEHPAAPPPAEETSKSTDAPVETPAAYGVRALKKLLDGVPDKALVDRLMYAEFTRPDGSRKTALQLLREGELRRDGARAEVLDALESKLRELEVA